MLRAQLEEKAHHDPLALYQTLQEVDPKAAAKLHPNDLRRIIRALEVYYTRGQPISELQAKMGEQRKYTPVMIGLTRKRELLYQRIEQRVDQMVADGLVEEVKTLLQRYPSQPTALQAIGYKEIARFLHGELTLEEALALIKRETRRYAKRQWSWFRRDQRIVWYDLDVYTTDQIIAATQERLAQATH